MKRKAHDLGFDQHKLKEKDCQDDELTAGRVVDWRDICVRSH